MDAEQTNQSLELALGGLRRRAPWILLCLVLVTGAAYGFSKREQKQYTATASLVFNDSQANQQAAGLQAVSVNNQQAQENTNLKLVQLGDMAEKTASRVGRGQTKEKIKEALSISALGESNVVNVAATATSPTLAAAIANTYAKRFVFEQQESNHKYYASALSPAERAGTSGLALESRAQSLGVLAELRNGNVQIAQTASVPTSPSSPKTARNTALGAVLGLLLGLGIAFLLERFDRRIREPKDLEAVYGLPLLGVVPESGALSRSARGKASSGGLMASEAEAFHLIRAHLRYFNVDKELRTLLVASAAPGDGKTTVARHLASAAARMGARTLLVEADLRRPTMAQQFEIHSSGGLSDVLIGAVAMNDAIQSIPLDRSGNDVSRTRTLDVLFAGAVLPPNPGELIESRAMENLLDGARSTYDLVVIDTPPLTVVSDAFPLLGKVDGVIVVGRVGRNRRDVAARLHETLLASGAPLLGVVANGFKTGRLGSYGYGYDYAPAKPEQPSSVFVTPNGVAAPETHVPTAKG
jgi:capsular exopolysaccharide synthesis family protein